MATFNLKNDGITNFYITESAPRTIDAIPKKMRVLKCWAVYKTEVTDSGTKKRVCYYTHKKHANVANPRTWLSFGQALALIAKYPDFEGLIFIKPVEIACFDGENIQREKDVISQTYYKIRNLRTFLKYKCPFRGGCQ